MADESEGEAGNKGHDGPRGRWAAAAGG